MLGLLGILHIMLLFLFICFISSFFFKLANLFSGALTEWMDSFRVLSLYLHGNETNVIVVIEVVTHAPTTNQHIFYCNFCFILFSSSRSVYSCGGNKGETNRNLGRLPPGGASQNHVTAAGTAVSRHAATARYGRVWHAAPR